VTKAVFHLLSFRRGGYISATTSKSNFLASAKMASLVPQAPAEVLPEVQAAERELAVGTEAEVLAADIAAAVLAAAPADVQPSMPEQS